MIIPDDDEEADDATRAAIEERIADYIREMAEEAADEMVFGMADSLIAYAGGMPLDKALFYLGLRVDFDWKAMRKAKEKEDVRERSNSAFKVGSRKEEIAVAVLQGETVAQVGRRYDLTQKRVEEIVAEFQANREELRR